MSKQRIIPPEFIALVPPSVQDYPPRIKGFIFRLHDGHYFKAAQKGITRDRNAAYVYTLEDIYIGFMGTCYEQCIGKAQGHWIIVYER